MHRRDPPRDKLVGVVWEQKPVRVNLPFHGLFDVNFLELPNAKAVARWLERLLTWEIVRQTGRTKGTGYFIDPVVLRTLEFPSQTTLTRIEPQRLRELILEDLRRHPGSAYGEIQARIGREIPVNQVRWQLKSLVDAGKLRFEGEKRWRKYSIL